MISHQNWPSTQNNQFSVPYGYKLVPDPALNNINNSSLLTNTQSGMNRMGGIPGRIVTSIEEIRPNEVPSDGTVSLFLKNDYTAIYAKAVNAQGTIDTVEYIPKPQEKQANSPETTTSVDFSEITERLDKIEKMIAKQKRPYYNKNHKTNKEES